VHRALARFDDVVPPDGQALTTADAPLKQEPRMNKTLLAALLAMLSGPALAHTGHGDASGFLHGLEHPVLGADHLLAMLAVGLWSGFVVPTRFWLGAVVFLGAMTAGALMSWVGTGFPLVEPVIAASVVVFGLLTLLSRRGQGNRLTVASLAVIAAFAVAHGHAHATEATGNAFAYLAGFLIATTALHVAGIAIARALAAQPRVQGALGAGITLSGLWLMAG
jgi:urease accessory protein